MFTLKFTVKAETLLYLVLNTEDTKLVQGRKKKKNQMVFSDPFPTKEEQGGLRSQF